MSGESDVIITERGGKMEGKWLRITGGAEYVGVSTRTFRDWLYKLGLKHSRVGGVVLINRDDINEFIDAQATGG